MPAAPPPVTKRQTLPHGGGPVHTVVFNTGGRYCLSGGQNRIIKLWNPGTGSLLKSYEGHGYEVLGLAVSAANSHFASCGGDRNVFWWDVSKGETVRRFTGHNSRVNTVALNTEVSILASGGYDATVRLWDLKSQQRMPIQILQDAKDSITCCLIRDGLIITGCVDGYVRTYDLRKGELRSDFFDQPVISVSLLPDCSAMLVSTLAGEDPQQTPGMVRLIDSSDGKLLKSFKGHQSVSYRSGGSFGRNDETVLQGDETGRLYSWSVESGQKLSETKIHDKVVTWVARHPTTDQIITAGAEGDVHVWSDAQS